MTEEEDDAKDWIMSLPTVRCWEVWFENGKCFEFASYVGACYAVNEGSLSYYNRLKYEIKPIVRLTSLAGKHFKCVGNSA